MNLVYVEEIVKLAMIIMAALIALNFYVRSKILNLLRESHEEVWKELGSPSLVQNNSFQNGAATLRFIWRREHRRLNSPPLDQLARTERMLHVVQGGVLLLALSLMITVLVAQ